MQTITITTRSIFSLCYGVRTKTMTLRGYYTCMTTHWKLKGDYEEEESKYTASIDKGLRAGGRKGI